MMRLVFGKRLPITSGSIELSGIRGPVTIDRDRWGVPYIKATNDADAWFGLGFTHGQDRAFQIEILLRAMRGTLSGLTGPDALPIDRLSRRIGFHRSALKQLAALDDDIRETLDAYARGISEGSTRGGTIAHEFALLKSSPTPYQASDVLALMKLTAFLLASNWDSELVRYKMLLEDGAEAVKALDPTYPEWLPQTMIPGLAAGDAVDRLSVDLETFETVVGLDGGSNNWALSGDRTDSGLPIVANDPHLGPTHPSHWYLARVATPDWAVAGASLLGSPGFPVGFNGHCGWGVTAGLTDNTDLFLEEIGPDGTSVRIGGDFVQCEVHIETIEVKGGDTVVERVLETLHGPIIGPALSENEAAISMRAVWLDARPLRGLLDLHRVETVGDIREAYRAWPGLPLNVVSADDNGD
ncbi:MAG: penicillin acylase family protein, partial [Acidimicrobiia bacterium]